MDQLSLAKKTESDTNAEIQQTNINIAHLAKQLKEAEPRARSVQKENNALVNEMNRQMNIMSSINADLKNLSFNLETEKMLEIARLAKRKEVSEIEMEINNLERNQGGMKFVYTSPSPDFDPALVKGLIAELIDIPQENLDSSTALEVCAGGKLYNVHIY